jgi:hypothetical protein
MKIVLEISSKFKGALERLEQKEGCQVLPFLSCIRTFQEYL